MMLTILALAMAQVEPPIDCNTQVTKLEMAQCELIDFQRSDAALNRQWRLALAVAQQFDRDNAAGIRRAGIRGAENNLRTAQRAWITYRDAQCEAEARDHWAGATRHLIQNNCLRGLTEARTRQLLDLSERAENR